MGVDMHEPVFHIYRETKEYQTCREKFERVGWVPFLEKIIGHHEGVSHAFTQSYDGEIVQLGELKLTIIEATIEEETELPSTREKYFEEIVIDRILC
jgi:hypothetical protein